jgi:hypothetical protein
MRPRRLLSALLAPVVLATGLAAAVHAHLPRIETRSGITADATFHVHDAGCPVCRLAHESAPAALPVATFAVAAPSWTIGDSAEPVPLECAVDLARSPRAPPVLPLA